MSLRQPRVGLALLRGTLRSQVLDALDRGGIACDDPDADDPAWLPLVVIEPAPEGLDGLASDGLQHCSQPAPARMLVAPASPAYSRGQAVDAGAEDLFLWPEEAEALVARTRAVLRRREADLDLHPLTGLPGGAALHRDLQQRLNRPATLAVLGIDLCNFKAFNDCYGFRRGDQVLLELAAMLQTVAGSDGIVYHIGGDDFFVVCRPEFADDLGAAFIQAFASNVRDLYDEQDAARGFITALDRRSGQPVGFSLMSLTVACATNEAADVTHVARLAHILAELKQYARATGRDYARDRRSVHDVDRALRLKPDTDQDPATGG